MVCFVRKGKGFSSVCLDAQGMLLFVECALRLASARLEPGILLYDSTCSKSGIV